MNGALADDHSDVGQGFAYRFERVALFVQTTDFACKRSNLAIQAARRSPWGQSGTVASIGCRFVHGAAFARAGWDQVDEQAVRIKAEFAGAIATSSTCMVESRCLHRFSFARMN
jgi:hypothetical protein